MVQVTKKLGKRLWGDESIEFPQVVFDSIKDNPRYVDLIVNYDPTKGKAWHLLFFLEFLRSLWDLPAFADVLAKFSAYTCGELQHERFESPRLYVLDTTAQVSSVFHYSLPTISDFKLDSIGDIAKACDTELNDAPKDYAFGD